MVQCLDCKQFVPSGHIMNTKQICYKCYIEAVKENRIDWIKSHEYYRPIEIKAHSIE